MDTLEGARAITALAKHATYMLEQGTLEDEAAGTLKDLLARNKYFIKRVANYRNRPFLLPARLLDTTQPEDFDYLSPEWRIRWLRMKHRYYRKDVGHNLSCSRNLTTHVLAQNVLYSYRQNYLNVPANKFGIFPEVSFRGYRRCIYVRENGMRCHRYGSGHILCHLHSKMAAMKDLFGNQIKCANLKEHYLEQLANPDYKNAQSELALLRTILGTMVEKLDGSGKDMLYYDNIVSLCKVVTNTVESISHIETKNNMRLSIDQLQNLIAAVVGVVVKVIEPSDEQLNLLAEGIEHLQVFRTDTGNAGMLTFGMTQHVSPVKKTTALDAYTPEGIMRNHFSQEQVKESQDDSHPTFEEGMHERAATRTQMEDIAARFGLEEVPFYR